MVTLAMMAKAAPALVLRAIASAAHMIDEVCLVVAPGDPLTTLKLPLPGRIVEEPWQGGGAIRRNATLRHAESSPRTSWVVMLDADDTFVEGSTLPADLDSTPVDVFATVIEGLFSGGRWRWYRTGHLMRARSGASFDGPLHEALVPPPSARLARFAGLVLREEPREGVRAGGRTYNDDARALAEHLAANPNDTRAAFYYAQSLKDARRWAEAYTAFLARAAMQGGFIEETFWALLWAAKLAPFVGVPHDVIVQRHLEAHAHSPMRAEPLSELAGYLARKGFAAEAREYAARAASMPYPQDAMSFVDVGAYSPAALTAARIV